MSETMNKSAAYEAGLRDAMEKEAISLPFSSAARMAKAVKPSAPKPVGGFFARMKSKLTTPIGSKGKMNASMKQQASASSAEKKFFAEGAGTPTGVPVPTAPKAPAPVKKKMSLGRKAGIGAALVGTGAVGASVMSGQQQGQMA